MTHPLFSMAERNALVTGSSRGIGKAIALAFAEAGAKTIILHGIEPEEKVGPLLEQIANKGARAEYVSQDLSLENGGHACAKQALEKAQRLDVVVLNASMQIRKPWEEITAKEYQHQMNVNFLSSLQILQTLIPIMQKAKWGRLLTIGSMQQVKPHPHMTVYAASKSAQMNLTINLAKQLAEDGITVNSLSPGTILTDRNAEALQNKEYAAKVIESIPVKSFGNPSDCIGAALLLCSEASRYITGINLPVDGGASIS